MTERFENKEPVSSATGTEMAAGIASGAGTTSWVT